MSHIYKRNSIYWLAFYKDGKLYRQSLKTKDRTTAHYSKSKIEQEVAEGKYTLYNPDITCDKVFEEYKKATTYHKAPDTCKLDNMRIASFLEWSGISKLNQITDKRLQDYLNHRILTDKITLQTANHHITIIKTFLNFGVKRKFIPENPIKQFKKYKIPKNPPKFLTKDETEKLLKKAKATPLYPLILTGLYTGMRRNELFNLDWQDIDFARDIITVRNKDDFTTKSKNFRTIPLNNALKAVLLPRRKANGRCFDITNERRIFRRLIKDTGVKGEVGYHILRHTFASHLAMQGVDLTTIASILGHADISTTLIYAHLTKDHIKSAVEKLDF